MPLKSSRQEAKNQQFADRRQRSAQVKTRWLDDKTSLLLVGGIFVIHCLGLASLFAPLSGLFNNQPVIEQDWGLHFHHLKSMAAFWHQDRNIWGYNPLFVAGYPSNTIQDLSIKFFEFAALGLATFGLAPIQWFKLLAFLAMAGIPWFMYFAARNLFFDRSDIKNGAALMAALLGTAYWWNSLPREMFFYGMIGYPPAAYTSVLGATLLYRIAKHRIVVERHSFRLARHRGDHSPPPRSIHRHISAAHRRSPFGPRADLSPQSIDLDRRGRSFVDSRESAVAGNRLRSSHR